MVRRWRRRNLPRLLRDRPAVQIRIVPYYQPALDSVDNEQSQLLNALADQICAGRIPFLSYETQDLGLSPAWNKDFISGKEWEMSPSSSLPVVRFDGSDIKVPWELSRLQFLPILGKAYRLTGKSGYRKTALHFVDDWISRNPVGQGVNWVVAMEVALRALSILFLVTLLNPFADEEQDWLNRVTESLWQHLVYMEANLEFSYIVRGNHYLSNLLGLYGLSIFMEGPGLQQRRHRYKRLLEREILLHTYPDGGNYEASSGYHVLVAQIFLTACQLMRADGSAPSQAFLGRLQKMFDWMESIADQSGRLPHVGDCDDGRVEFLIDDLRQMARLPVAARDSLRVGSLIGLGRTVLHSDTIGGSGEAAWFGFRNQNNRPARAQTGDLRDLVLPDSGIAMAGSKEADVLFLALPNGIHGKGTHTHNDKLSVILRMGGEEVLCDAGTGCYTRDGEMRNRFRSTSAHNTIMIDGQEQNSIPQRRHGFFSLGNEARVSRIESVATGTSRRFTASHFGYRDRSVVHTRSIEWNQNGRVQIEDQLSGAGIHSLAIYFHSGPEWRFSKIVGQEHGINCSLEGKRAIHLSVTVAGEIMAEVIPGSLSWVYGSVIPSSTLRIKVTAEFPTRILTNLGWEV